MQIRPATVQDAEQIALVQVRSWQATYRGSMPQHFLDQLRPDSRTAGWREHLAAPAPGEATVVADDGTLRGFGHVGPTWDTDAHPERVGQLRALYLIADLWGRGHGRALLAAATNALAQAGFAEATLWVLEANLRDRRFYEAAGWSCDGATQRDESRGFPLDEVRYRRGLR